MTTNEGTTVVKQERRSIPLIAPFLLGAAIGGFGGAILGSMLAPYISAATAEARTAIVKITRKGDSDQPKFELLLQ